MAITSALSSLADAIFWLSPTDSMALIWSRSTAARSKCVASADSCIFRRRLRRIGSVSPSKNMMTWRTTSWYSSRLTAPMHGATHRWM